VMYENKRSIEKRKRNKRKRKIDIGKKRQDGETNKRYKCDTEEKAEEPWKLLEEIKLEDMEIKNDKTLLTSATKQKDKTSEERNDYIDQQRNIFLYKIGSQLANKDYAVGLLLGLSDADIVNIKRSEPLNAAHWGYQILLQWWQRHPNRM
ncbi:unnamed protein product, partial [Owenia fusiformis]